MQVHVFIPESLEIRGDHPCTACSVFWRELAPSASRVEWRLGRARRKKCTFLRGPRGLGAARIVSFLSLSFQFHFFLFLKRKQEERVQQVRKKLEEALMADILSRAVDTEEVDIDMDSGDEA